MNARDQPVRRRGALQQADQGGTLLGLERHRDVRIQSGHDLLGLDEQLVRGGKYVHRVHPAVGRMPAPPPLGLGVQ